VPRPLPRPPCASPPSRSHALSLLALPCALSLRAPVRHLFVHSRVPTSSRLCASLIPVLPCTFPHLRRPWFPDVPTTPPHTVDLTAWWPLRQHPQPIRMTGPHAFVRTVPLTPDTMPENQDPNPRDSSQPTAPLLLPHTTDTPLAAVTPLTGSFFARAQTITPSCRSAPFVSVGTDTMYANAIATSYGTDPPPAAEEIQLGKSWRQEASFSAPTGKSLTVAQAQPTTQDTYARDAATRLMVLRNVLEHRKHLPLSPYNPEAWRSSLEQFNLLGKYPSLLPSLANGFDFGIPPIQTTFTPPNGSSIDTLSHHFSPIFDHEFARGRYIGLLSRAETELLIGPFQSSPLSITPKSNKPDKFHLVQDLSFPHSASHGFSSINSHINSDCFPTTWGTFNAISLTISVTIRCHHNM
jgi:hypothetical protein